VSEKIFPALTKHERENLQLIVRGSTNSDIAWELILRVKTVNDYVSNIFSKLQVTDRAQAIIRARDPRLECPAIPSRRLFNLESVYVSRQPGKGHVRFPNVLHSHEGIS
jgi:DNA-binding CsgD family transcriptional regulator